MSTFKIYKSKKLIFEKRMNKSRFGLTSLSVYYMGLLHAVSGEAGQYYFFRGKPAVRDLFRFLLKSLDQRKAEHASKEELFSDLSFRSDSVLIRDCPRLNPLNAAPSV